MPTPEQIRAHLEGLDLDPELKRRIAMTAGCSDCESIPKVADAGKILADGELRYQVMHNGVRVIEDGYCGKWMTETIKLLNGHHEPQEEKIFDRVLKYLPPDATMLEVGSWWGYYSLWFRQAIRNATNYLIEPDPNHLAIGKRNFQINSAEGLFFQLSIGREASGPRPFVCESDGVSRSIAQTSIDHFVSAQDLNRIDLLLADVQGAELSMLEGAIESIASGKIRFLFLSTHHHSMSGDPLTHQKCLGFLQDRQAHIVAAHNVTESYSGDGLIVASFDDRDRQIPEVEITRNYPTNSLFRELEYDLAERQQELREIRKRFAERLIHWVTRNLSRYVLR